MCVNKSPLKTVNSIIPLPQTCCISNVFVLFFTADLIHLKIFWTTEDRNTSQKQKEEKLSFDHLNISKHSDHGCWQHCRIDILTCLCIDKIKNQFGQRQ